MVKVSMLLHTLTCATQHQLCQTQADLSGC